MTPAARVLVHEPQPDLFESGLDRRDLGQDVDAVAILLDHALYPAVLSLDAAQAVLQLVVGAEYPRVVVFAKLHQARGQANRAFRATGPQTLIGIALRRRSRRRSRRPSPLPRGSAKTISSAPRASASRVIASTTFRSGAARTWNSMPSWFPTAREARDRSSLARSRHTSLHRTERVSQHPFRGSSCLAKAITVTREAASRARWHTERSPVSARSFER